MEGAAQKESFFLPTIETEAPPGKVLQTETGEKITTLDATCILLSLRDGGQGVAEDPDTRRRGFL